MTIPLEGNTKIWDAATFTKLGELEGPIFGSYNGSNALFSSDGKYLAVGLAAGPGDVSLWRTSDWALLWQGGFFGFAFSPDGKYFSHTAYGETGAEQVVLSFAGQEKDFMTLSQVYDSMVGRLFFSPDSTKLAVYAGFTETQVWSAETGEQLFSYRATCGE